MRPRFYCDHPIEGTLVVLQGPEAHHLMHVHRLAVGNVVELFDGRGSEFEAEILSIGRKDVRCKIVMGRAVDRENTTALCLGVALPKGDRQQLLVEKCVELGVRRFVPLQTRHSVAKSTRSSEQRLRRYVIEASKQCRRNVLMQIAEPATTDAFWQQPPADAVRWFADRSVSGEPTALARIGGRPVFAAIGPEGGWHDDERQMAAEAGWTPFSLGKRVLRIETAALVIAAWCGLPDNDRL